jgi:tetratricopeptide (TPR) repeat protein
LLSETAERLRAVKGNRKTRLAVIPLDAAVQNKIAAPDKAAKLLGATHILKGTLRKDGERTSVHVFLFDARSFQLQERQAEFGTNDLRNAPVFLAGVVTSTLGLPPLAVSATVNAAAYADFVAGVELARRDDRLDAALPLLERAVAADRDSPVTHARLAEAQAEKYWITKDAAWLDKAKASLADAELRNPDLAVVRWISGKVNRYTGAYEAAEADLKRSLALESHNGDAWRNLGLVYQETSHLADAVTAYQGAIDSEPSYFKNYQALCSAYTDQTNYKEAIQQCQKMVALAPDLSESYFALAVAYLNGGHYPDAETQSRLAQELDPNSVKSLLTLATALNFQHRSQEAVPYLQRAREIGPETDLLYLDLGTTLLLAGRPEEATTAFRRGVTVAEQTLRRNYRDGLTRSHLAYLCARIGERSRAEFEAPQAWAFSPGSVTVARNVIMTYEVLQERERALAFARTAPDDAIRRVKQSPEMADLGNDPRFLNLMQSHHIQ